MKTLKNVTIYQCEFCNKRLLSKNGAKLHEEQYCKNKNSPHQENILKGQMECEHKNVGTHYEYMAGEAVKEPAYDFCMDCGLKW